MIKFIEIDWKLNLNCITSVEMVEYGSSSLSNSQPLLHGTTGQLGSATLTPSANNFVKLTAYMEHWLYPLMLFPSKGIPSDKLMLVFVVVVVVVAVYTCKKINGEKKKRVTNQKIVKILMQLKSNCCRWWWWWWCGCGWWRWKSGISIYRINYIVKGQISNYASRWKNRYRFSHGSINTHQPIDQKVHAHSHRIIRIRYCLYDCFIVIFHISVLLLLLLRIVVSVLVLVVIVVCWLSFFSIKLYMIKFSARFVATN